MNATRSSCCFAGFHQPFLVFGRQLRPVDLERQLVELAGERERHLVVLVVHRRAGVGADVEGLVPLQDERERVFHLLGGDFLAVHLEHAGAALADAAHVVEGQRARAEAVVLEVELDACACRARARRGLPSECASGRPGSRGTPACP